MRDRLEFRKGAPFMDYDVIIIGGSFAGLSAAMQLVRGRRSVGIVDAGQPRNRFAEASHGFFGQDGAKPLAMIERARAQVLAYPTATLIDGEAITAQKTERGDFAVGLASGEVLTASRLVLATGVRDVLPDIAGLRERWGVSVLHCPYCHGYEYAGDRLGVLRTKPGSPHQAMLVAEWGPLTYFLNGHDDLSAEDRAELERRHIAIEPAPIADLLGPAPGLEAIRLTDGRTLPLDALFLAPEIRLPTLAEQLGCVIDETPNGLVVRVDPMKQTTIPGLFAAGDIITPMWNATLASADGVMAGAAVHRSLVF
jgi:thioredoxin reductase